MRRFLLQAVASVVLLMLLGLLDLGACLRAEHISCADPGPLLGAGADDFDRLEPEAPPGTPTEAWPAPPAEVTPFDGMGQASRPSDSGGSPHPLKGLFRTAAWLPEPQLVLPLRAAAPVVGLPLPLSTLFRPPRVSG